MRATVCCGLLALAGTAQANWITLEPDDYAPGTDVSHAVSVYTLSAAMTTPAQVGNPQYTIFDPVYSALSDGSVTGTRNFSNSPTTGFGWEKPDIDANLSKPTFRVDFSGAVDSIGFLWAHHECVEGGSCLDMAEIKAYDAYNNLLMYCNFNGNSQGGPGCSNTWLGFNGDNFGTFSATYTSASANIAYVLIGGNVGIDRFTADVPEPGTLALLGAGLLGIGLRRRRAS